MRAALPPGRRLRNALARLLLWLSAAAACALLLLIAGYIFFRGAPGVSLELLTGRDSVLEGTVGILPSILNTLYVIAASLAIVTPVGVGAAIYLTEYAKNRRLAGAIEFAAETLAGIPSILYAMMGTMVFCTALGLQRTLLAGSLTLAVMTLPTVIRTTQESLKAVPRSYREGALGLGAGQCAPSAPWCGPHPWTALSPDASWLSGGWWGRARSSCTLRASPPPCRTSAISRASCVPPARPSPWPCMSTPRSVPTLPPPSLSPPSCWS